MLGDKMAIATLPVSDLGMALDFYKNTLGLTEVRKSEWDANLSAGKGSMINIYLKGTSKADHTELTFPVDDLETEMTALRGKDVVFEEYDIPEMKIKTENGLAIADDGTKMAWFKDLDNNIIGLVEM